MSDPEAERPTTGALKSVRRPATSTVLRSFSKQAHQSHWSARKRPMQLARSSDRGQRPQTAGLGEVSR